MIRIAIKDNHTIFRKSLSLLINKFKNMIVSVEASTEQELLEQLATSKIDIVLLNIAIDNNLDLGTPDIILKKFPNIKILILTPMSKSPIMSKVVDLGVHGYLDHQVNPEELEDALTTLSKDGFIFRNLSSVLPHVPISRTDKYVAIITEREIEIIKLAAKELSGKEIADSLNISLRTVEVHKKNLMTKTNSKNFIGVILYVLHHRVLKISDL